MRLPWPLPVFVVRSDNFCCIERLIYEDGNLLYTLEMPSHRQSQLLALAILVAYNRIFLLHPIQFQDIVPLR